MVHPPTKEIPKQRIPSSFPYAHVYLNDIQQHVGLLANTARNSYSGRGADRELVSAVARAFEPLRDTFTNLSSLQMDEVRLGACWR